MKKLTVLAIGAAGYVVGARAGRERYEQIKTQATKTWNNPKVQSAVGDVQTQAKQAGADVSHKVADKLKGGDPDTASGTYTPRPADVSQNGTS